MATNIDRKLVLCVPLLSCVYICYVPVDLQQCVHLRSTASQQLCVHYLPFFVIPTTAVVGAVKICVHLLSVHTAVCTFAQVYQYTVVYTVA